MYYYIEHVFCPICGGTCKTGNVIEMVVKTQNGAFVECDNNPAKCTRCVWLGTVHYLIDTPYPIMFTNGKRTSVALISLTSEQISALIRNCVVLLELRSKNFKDELLVPEVV